MAVSISHGQGCRRGSKLILHSAARYKATGSYVPKETFPDELRGFDAILFGAVGDPDVRFAREV